MHACVVSWVCKEDNGINLKVSATYQGLLQVLCHFPTLPLVFIRRVKNKEMEILLVSLFYCNTAEYCYYTYRHDYSHVKKGYTCPREH